MKKYTYKFFYNDGSSKIYDGFENQSIDYLFYDLDGLIPWDEYEALEKNKPSMDETLALAKEAYRKYYGDYEHIAIIDKNTEEVIKYL